MQAWSLGPEDALEAGMATTAVVPGEWATDHRVAKSQTRLKRLNIHTYKHETGLWNFEKSSVTGGCLHPWMVLQIGLEKLSSTLTRVCFAIMGHKVCSVSSKQRWWHPQCWFRGLFKEPSREIQSGWAGSREQGTSLLGSEVRPPREGPLWDKLFWLKKMHEIPPPPHRPVRCLPHGSLSHGKVFQLFYWHFQTSSYWTVYFFKGWGFGFKKKNVFSFLTQPTSMPRPSPEVVFPGGSEGAAALSARRCPGPGALGRRPLSPWEPGPPERRLRPGIRRPPRGADRLQNVAIKWELPRLQGDINCH